MEAEAWTADHPLIRAILERPVDYQFFQLLHLMELTNNDQALPGESGPARRERVRLRPELGMTFPAGDIATADWHEDEQAVGRLRVTTTFMGLYGSNSPLATHFTEALLADRDEDRVVRDFLDLFHHRIFSLLYRVWKKYRYYVTYRPDAQDPISRVVCGLLGIGTADTAEQLEVAPTRYFRYTGLLSQRPRSAAGLEGMLRDYYGQVPVEVAQCIGRWLPVDESQKNVLGRDNCRLGQDTIIGDRVYDCSGKFRVRVGPMGFNQYLTFLPTGDAMHDLREIAGYYSTDPLEFDAELILKGEEVPSMQLGGDAVLGRIAWTSWVKSKPVPDQSVIFAPRAGMKRASLQ